VHIQSRTRIPDTDTDADTNTHTGKYLSKQDTLLNYAVMEAMRLSAAFGQSISFPFDCQYIQLSNLITISQHSLSRSALQSQNILGGIEFPQDSLSSSTPNA
jgi:hypothetical protein